MSHVVPDIVQKIVKGQDPLHILGAGNQIRHYTYAGDLARGIRLCIENPNALNEDFNISTPDSTTVLKLAKAIWEKINPNKPFSYVSDTPYKYDAGFSVEQAKAVFLVEWNDERAKVANMLAMVTGIRAGEIQGLRIMDIGQTCVFIRHSWNHRDGLKSTKNNEERTVEVPFPNIIADLLRIANKNPHGASQETFVFWADKSAEKPMEQKIFIRELRE
ncbi:MAG: NAD-dependent epimerase/dehydratase family protein, partial [Spirochaetaceae bacterium]|nr:NAD-dependent epimerase/dehydratase family protein [Spirochaetaceae bacterium]